MQQPFREVAPVKFLHNSGLYIHIPFCNKKCAYCDFYSVIPSENLKNDYLSALLGDIKLKGGQYDRPFDTVYIGGGTPSVLGKNIKTLLDAIKDNFNVSANAEITTEVNPDVSDEFLEYGINSGINRISIGLQSGNDEELKILGRTHTANDGRDAVNRIKSMGYKNISADLMIALPNSNLYALQSNLDYFNFLDIPHISSYILKVESNTKFSKFTPPLPDDDNCAQQYLAMCDYFENMGYSHYEISNFSKPGFESKHNLKYWNCEEYLGLGPSAHSFMDGKRFFYPKNIKNYIISPNTEFEDIGGEILEKIMLKLRLKSGLELSEFGLENIIPKLDIYKTNQLIRIDGTRISLTNKGMLVSNSIISAVLELVYENI